VQWQVSEKLSGADYSDLLENWPATAGTPATQINTLLASVVRCAVVG